MKHRIAEVFARKSYSADSTEVIDLDLTDPISQLVLTYEAVNGSVATQQGHPDLCVTKIELVDGSDVLFSLSGKEAKALDFYHNRRVTPSMVIYPNDINAEMIYNINFGRKLWDPLLALIPGRFRNLQLKVTIDINGGGKMADAGYLTVAAKCFDEKQVSPMGFLMHKELKSYTLAASGWEYTDLPLDFPFRMLLMKCQAYGSGPDYQLDTVKLSEDNDKRIPFNMTIGEILRMIMSEWPPYDEWVLDDPPTPSSGYTYITPGYWPSAIAQEWLAPCSSDNIIGCFSGDGGRLTVGTSGGWTSNAMIHVKGWCPHSTIVLPMGDPEDPEDWFDPAALRNLKLSLKGGASLTAGTCEIFAQQLRRY
jgi:hypothetical protein